MEIFFTNYHDPLFSIIILFLIVFIISFVSYWWSIYKHKEENNQIKNFIKKFETNKDLLEYEIFAKDKNISLESIILIALLYEKQGEYEKAIEIYLMLLERVESKEEKIQIFTMLGKLYFKAGFLKRSEITFLEGLKYYPRNKEALKYLLVIYDKLRKYNRVLEILNSLEELGVDVKKQKEYIQALGIITDLKLSYLDKKKKLLKLCEKSLSTQRVTLEFISRNEKDLKFKEISFFNFYEVMDILWYLPKERIVLADTDNKALLEILSARGIVKRADKSDIFELDVLIKLKNRGYDRADLRFEYICKECKQVFPLFFYRCPHCYSFDSACIIPKIVRSENEKGNNL